MTSFSKIKVLTPHLFWGAQLLWQSWQSWHVEWVPSLWISTGSLGLKGRHFGHFVSMSSPCYPWAPLGNDHIYPLPALKILESMIFPFPQVLWFLMLPKTNSLQGTKMPHHWKRKIIFSLLMGYVSSREGMASSSGPKALCILMLCQFFTGGTCYCSF